MKTKKVKIIVRPDLFGLLDEIYYTLIEVEKKVTTLNQCKSTILNMTQFSFVEMPEAQSMIRGAIRDANLFLDSFGRMKRKACGKTSIKLVR